MSKEPIPPEEAREIERRWQIRGAGIFWRNPFSLLLMLGAAVLFVVREDVLWDYFRCVALALSIYIVLFSARIIHIHYKLSHALHNSETKLLPKHVQLIALSYIIFVVDGGIRAIRRLGEGAQWHGLPFILVADVIGASALAFVWQFELAKAKRAGARF